METRSFVKGKEEGGRDVLSYISNGACLAGLSVVAAAYMMPPAEDVDVSLTWIPFVHFAVFCTWFGIQCWVSFVEGKDFFRSDFEKYKDLVSNWTGIV